jgi:predicted dehydrogenase
MPIAHGRPTRRAFLYAGAAVAATAVLPRPRLVRAVSPSDKLNVAFIGVRGKGRDDLVEVAKTGAANVVALCDVDANHLAQAGEEYPDATQHRDFRRMLEQQKDIDAVVVTAPDHCHAAAALMAMRLGKHVYCQKPLTYTIAESRALADAARSHKVATQMGNNGHARPGLRQLVDWVKGGLIGPVREVHVWSDRPTDWWPQGVERPAPAAVPEHLDWDLWLGPAPERPYGPGYHPFDWRGFIDFGTGALGDMGCHIIDAPCWALDLTGDCTVEAIHEGMTAESYPKWSVVTYQFPARGARPAVTMTWHDGGRRPPRPAGLPDDLWPTGRGAGGCLFVGERGQILGGHMGRPPTLLDADGTPVPAADVDAPAATLPESPGHYVEWVNACRGGPAALSHFDYAAPLTETVLLGNLAIRLGKRIEWDAKSMKATNAPEADALVRREYRKGWEV